MSESFWVKVLFFYHNILLSNEKQSHGPSQTPAAAYAQLRGIPVHLAEVVAVVHDAIEAHQPGLDRFETLEKPKKGRMLWKTKRVGTKTKVETKKLEAERNWNPRLEAQRQVGKQRNSKTSQIPPKHEKLIQKNGKTRCSQRIHVGNLKILDLLEKHQLQKDPRNFCIAFPKPSKISGTRFRLEGSTVVTPMAKPSGMPPVLLGFQKSQIWANVWENDEPAFFYFETSNFPNHGI